MPAPTLEQVRQQFPEFSSQNDETVNAAIRDAYAVHRIRPQATLYLVAHILSLVTDNVEQPDGGMGIVVKETLGPKAIDYKTMSNDADTLKVWCEATHYGRMFLVLYETSIQTKIAIVQG